jgi:AI-2 transport protein TqsA
MTENGSFSTPARLVIAGAAAFIVIAGMNLSADILNVLFFSFFLAIISVPLIRILEKRGIPTIGAVVILIAGLVLLAILFIGILSLSLPALEETLPAYEALLSEQMEALVSLLAGWGIVISPPDQDIIINSTTTFIPAITTILSGLIQFLIDLLLIIIIAIFMLFEVLEWEKILDNQAENTRKVGSQIIGFSQTLMTYVIVRIKVNLITGAATAALLWALGIEPALLWGLLVFLMSFIPYIGLALATIPPMAIAWLEYGIVGVAIVIVGITIINVVAENIIFPQMAGKSLNLSPLTVIVSLLIWTAVLGVPGMFLGVPLTLMVKYLLEAFDETAFLARLMEPAVQGEKSHYPTFFTKKRA